MPQGLGKKESINCLECCEKSFMEGWIIKLYSKKMWSQARSVVVDISRARSASNIFTDD